MPCAGVSANLSVSAIIIVADSQLATGFLDDRWRDGLAIVGAVGVLLTLVGVIVAIWQLYKTQSATAAATTAALDAINDSKKRYETYVLAQANRLLSEAKRLVQSEQWQLAVIRLDDMAENVMQFATADSQWADMAETLRQFSVQFERVANEDLKPDRVRRKWHKEQPKLSHKLGQHHGPFLSVQQEPNDDAE
jgi:hypothetical protein